MNIEPAQLELLSVSNRASLRVGQDVGDVGKIFYIYIFWPFI
jgi:hypothetical protein